MFLLDIEDLGYLFAGVRQNDALASRVCFEELDHVEDAVFVNDPTVLLHVVHGLLRPVNLPSVLLTVKMLVMLVDMDALSWLSEARCLFFSFLSRMASFPGDAGARGPSRRENILSVSSTTLRFRF